MFGRYYLAAIAATLSFTAVAADTVCYGKTGNEDTGLAVCDPSSKVSSCCQYGQICYSNGLCQTPGATSINNTQLTIYSVEGCTQYNGTTGECAAVGKCLSIGSGVTFCGDNTFCCYGYNGCDCKNAKSTFSLAPGTILTTLPTAAATSRSSTTAKTTTSKPSSTTGVPTNLINSAIATIFSSNEATPAPNSIAVPVGVGVGVGGGVAALIVVGLLLYVRRRRNGGSRFKYGHFDKKEDLVDMYPPGAAKPYDPRENAIELDATKSPVQLGPSEVPESVPPVPVSTHTRT